jgi:glycerol-3-phosphate dehydrogenase subunit C
MPSVVKKLKMKKPNIDQCIKCSICTAYCPVFKATGLFPGPKLAGPDAERFRRQKKIIPTEWIEYCDYCKICERVCPHNVPIPELHLRSRLAWKAIHKPSLRNWLLGHSYFFERLGSWATPISNWVLAWSFIRWLMDRGLKLDRRTFMPAFNSQTFAKWFHSRPIGPGTPLAYFHGCYTNYIDPEIGKAVVGVLERNGFRVVVPPQECCGLPLIANGFLDLASHLGEKNINSLQKCVEKNVDIVFSSTSCGMTLLDEYQGILNLPGAGGTAEHIFDIFQFLLRLHDQGKLNRKFIEIKETYYYHAPCHLRAMGIGLPAIDLLSLIPGLKILELPEACCGLAGTYGMKKENSVIAAEVGQELFRAVRAADAHAVLSDCEACRMQITYHTGVKTRHPIQILHQAYGG